MDVTVNLAARLDLILAVAPRDGADDELASALVSAVPGAAGVFVLRGPPGRLALRGSAGERMPDGSSSALASRAITEDRIVVETARELSLGDLALAAAAPLPDGEGAVVLSLREASHLDEGARILLRLAADRAGLFRSRERDRAFARTSEATLEALLRAVGHDLRNPLGTMQMSTALLADRGGLSGWQARALERMRSSTGRMARLLSDFLVLARIGLGSELSFSPSLSRLDELVQQAAKELRAANRDRDISFDVESDTSGVFDVSRVQHVAEDLLAAALEYSEREVPVRVLVDGRKEDELSLKVETKGEIPESVLGRLAMDTSWPADAKEARAIGGGLGLVVSREILRTQGGSLTTKVDRGTIVFEARLPRRPVVH